MHQAVRGMALFERARRLVKPKPAGSVPIEVFAALVDDLYSNLMSFAIAATTAMLLGGIVASRTGSRPLIFLTVATAAVAAARALLVVEYYKRRSSITGDAAAPRRWERWYAVGAFAYGACLGSMSFVGFESPG